MTLSRILRISLIVAAIFMVFVCAVAVTMSSFWQAELFMVTGLTALLALSVAMACSIARDNGIQPKRMMNGIIAALATATVIMFLIWLPRHVQPPEALVVPIMAGVSWAGLMAVTGLLALPKPRAAWWCVLRRVTVISSYVLAACVVLGTVMLPDVLPFWTLLPFQNEYHAEDWLYRVGTGMSFLVSGLVVTTFLTMWLTPPVVSNEAQLSLSLQCPRCQFRHHRQTGDDRCSQCGLRIRVLVS